MFIFVPKYRSIPSENTSLHKQRLNMELNLLKVRIPFIT